MAKAFSVLSWNVEHFRGKADRLPKVVGVLATEKPDVIALYEVEGKAVFAELSQALPGYHWHITEGRQTQEILVGVKASKTAFFSQRTEFKSGNNYLRPGALLTLTINSENYSLLFLHLKSHSEPIGLGVRDDQLDHAFKLKRTLDKALPDGKDAHFIILGDLNTMGMKYPFDKAIDAATELKKIDRDAGNRWNRMRRLTKSTPWTWWNGPGSSYPKADLDHVIASKHLQFKAFNDKSGSSDKKNVDVRGWVDATTDNAIKTWIDQHSDHSYLVFEVNKA